MMNAYFFALIVVVIFLGIKYLVVLINLIFGHNIEISKLFSVKDLVLESITFYIIFFCLFLIEKQLLHKNLHSISFMIIGIINGSVLLSYDFIIKPIFDFFSNTKFIQAPEYENWIYQKFNHKVKIRIVEKDIFNAYATGIIPFSKQILLGKTLVINMLDNEIKGILSHEFAHLKKNHLLIIYVLNVIWCSIFFISLMYLIPVYKNLKYTELLVFLHGGLLGGINVIFIGYFRKRIEKSADLLAAQMVGADTYISALQKLHRLKNNNKPKRSFYYPTLDQRIAHIRKSN